MAIPKPSLQRFKRSDDELQALLPENFEVGQAISEGDYFFDAVAKDLTVYIRITEGKD